MQNVFFRDFFHSLKEQNKFAGTRSGEDGGLCHFWLKTVSHSRECTKSFGNALEPPSRKAG